MVAITTEQSGSRLNGLPNQADLTDAVYVFPLSPPQERIWRADERRPGNPAYNASFRWDLQGPLAPDVLERSLNEILRRHEILRATFARVKQKPVQMIASVLKLHIPLTDLRMVATGEREREIDRQCAEEAARSFDLTKGPLIRVGILCIADEHHILMLTLHHIISDGWSIGLIMEELQKIYCAFVNDQPSPLPELPIQYGDYVVWQSERIADDALAPQLAYWKATLAGYRRLELKTDLPRTAEQTTNSAIVSVLLPRTLTGALKRFSDNRGGTLFITALAGCMALLHRYTGATDIAVGSPLAGRNQADVENLIGLFVNHVIFRVKVAPDPVFSEFETLVRDTVLEAFSHQEVPFERIVEAVPEVYDTKDELFYSINFVCQREYARASTFVFDFAGMRITSMPSKSQGALYDLNFFMVERSDGWRLSIEYNSDLYLATTAERMLEAFRDLLEGIAVNPDKRISTLSSLPEGPRSASRALFNQ